MHFPIQKTYDQLLSKYRFSILTCILVSVTVGLAGCQSLMLEGSSATAGIAGAAIANKVTDNAGVTAGIGVGVQALTRSAVQYVLRDAHGDTQDVIAKAAGPLNVGEVAAWSSKHSIPLEPDEDGRVTVSRYISHGLMECKEIVYSVDSMVDGATAQNADQQGAILKSKVVTNSEFYVASICKDRNNWVWATAEPAVSRWGSLQ